MSKTKFLFLSIVFLCIGYSVSAQKVTLKLQKVKLERVLSDITRQTGYIFNYSRQIINPDKIVNIHVENVDVLNVLQKLFSDGKIGYTIKEKRILLTDNSTNNISQYPSSSHLTGRIIDIQGEPIIGATVIIKGTNNGTSTDVYGNFSLKEAQKGDILEISYIGYRKQEIMIMNQKKLSITLEEDLQTLNEVVVIGYGVQKKSDITGSVASVKATELNSAPNASTTQALQGKVAGVVVQNTSGDPSGGTFIRIRGANSLTYGNDPLIIIDGVQDASISSLNPNQIESMEVLKDAAALSIYGSRGANGVILITTKNGRNERAQVSYNGFVSFDQVSKTLPWLEAKQYASLMNEAQTANNLKPLFDERDIAMMGIGTIWQDEIFRNAMSHSHNVSIGGAKKAISYFIAGGIVDKNGIMINSDFQEYSIRANLKAEATKRLTISLNAFASYSQSHKGDTEGAITSALKWSPTKSVRDADGQYVQPGGGIGPVSDYNPVGLANEITQEATISNFNMAISGEYRFTDWLKFSSLLAYKSNSRMNGWFDNQVYNNGSEEDISGSKTQSSYWSLQNTNILTFDKEWNGHHIQATAVYELFKDQYNSAQASAKGIPVGMGYQGVHFGTIIQKPWVEYSSTAMLSVMGRVNYAYKNKYLLSASFRRDGASQLADGHKYDNFSAISAGWNVAEENFMKNTKTIISELKIRASYGSVGNAAVPAYSSQMKFNPGTDANGNPTLSIAQLANENLKWERTNELNIGVDTRWWNGRLSFSAEYYNKKTTDLLMWQKVPSALGVESVLTNVGSVRNKGWEFSFGGTPVSVKNFSWNVNYSINFNSNKILALDGQSNTLISTAFDMPGLVGSFVEMVGQPMGTFLGYEYAGVWKAQEVSTAALYGAKPGDAKYTDRNKDGKINSEDIDIIGNAQPKFTYGINNTFKYRNIDINIFFQGVYGNDTYNQNRVRRESYSGGGAFPTSLVIKDHWTASHQTDIPSFTGVEYVNSSRWVEDGSYLRLKNLTIGYNLPKKLLHKTHLSQLRLYVSATNLWTITNYSGYDPEASMGKDASGAGIDRGVYPSSKSWIIGLDLTF